MANNEFSMTTGQAHELAMSLGRNGWSNTQVKKACEGYFLREVLNVLNGLSEICPIEHTIDLSTDPFIPKGWKGVEEHRRGKVVKIERKGDNLYLNGEKIDFYLSEKQRKGSYSIGTDLRKELANQSILNANVLDYLLKPENQHLIPEEWKGKYIFFWGTIYRDANLNLYFRCLYWHGDGWDWFCFWLGYNFRGCHPAAVSAS